MSETTIDFKTKRGSDRSISIEDSAEFGINVSATGEIEPDVARRLAHALLFLADKVEFARVDKTAKLDPAIKSRTLDLRYTGR